jgi:hypothetical protein
MTTSPQNQVVAKRKAKKEASTLVIKAPNISSAAFTVVGTAPYVQHKFSAKARNKMLSDQVEGQSAKNKKKREPRDIEAEFLGAMHKTSDGENGIPAPAFRNAMISACRLVGFTMTKAKLSVFVDTDKFDGTDGTPLVILTGKPELHEASVRLESGVASIAIRPMWRTWSAVVRVRWDADQFSASDVSNLLARAGLQVGIGEGRPDSRKSNGLGWGLFSVKTME